MEASVARDRISNGRLAVIGVLALVALLAFLLLGDVRFNYDDPTVSLTDAASRQDMTTALITIEAICFVAVLLLLLVSPFGRPLSGEGWTSTGGAYVVTGDVVQIGCPGCGTVFEKPYNDVDEPHELSFQCPNCNRAGRLRPELRKAVQMRTVVCASCSNEFTAYREGAECPRCHALS